MSIVMVLYNIRLGASADDSNSLIDYRAEILAVATHLIIYKGAPRRFRGASVAF